MSPIVCYHPDRLPDAADVKPRAARPGGQAPGGDGGRNEHGDARAVAPGQRGGGEVPARRLLRQGRVLGRVGDQQDSAAAPSR